MQQQAAELQKKNRPAVLAELRAQMAAYGITAEELARTPAKASKPKAAPTKASSPARGKKPAAASPAKYFGPEGQTWSGRGPAPRWFADLLAQGQSRDDFLIAPDGAAAQ